MSVLVWVEVVDGEVSEVSYETLTFARDLSDDVHAVVVGSVEELTEPLGRYGVSKIHQVSDSGAAFAAYAPGAWSAAVLAAASACDTSVVVAPGSPRGNELMAHVAARADVLMAANAVTVDSRDPLQVSRQVFGGTALEVMELSERMAVLSVAGHACAAEPAAQAGAAEVESLEVSTTDADVAVQVARTEAGEPDESGSLKSAKVVIGAGRGVGGSEGFDELLEMTDLLHGSLGVSRVVTSLGWRPHHEQVGQTGSRISPELYVPCGISGAIQHWAGCSSAKTILAINSDPDAPMVTRAHYAVIGDLHEIVPAINEEIRRRVAG